MMEPATRCMAFLVRGRRARVAAVALGLCSAILGSAGTAAPDEIGRLFFTPQQRQELDRQRNTNVVESEAVVENLVTLNGQVVRSSGKTTTWINGVPQYDAYRGRASDRVGIESGDKSIGVKVGQTLDRSSGEVRDPLAGGQIVVPSKH
jgi:hypothetical protein